MNRGRTNRGRMNQGCMPHPHLRTAAQTDALLRAELAHWEPIIKASGFKQE